MTKDISRLLASLSRSGRSNKILIFRSTQVESFLILVRLRRVPVPQSGIASFSSFTPDFSQQGLPDLLTGTRVKS